MRNTKLTGFQGVGGKVTGVSVSSADGDKVLPADLVVVSDRTCVTSNDVFQWGDTDIGECA
jgi:hypothetical protein